MTRISDHKNQQKKSFAGVALHMCSFLLTFPPLWTWPFFKIQSQGIELTKTLLFILKVLWCSNNLMQKNDFYNPFYLSNYLSILKYFSNFFTRNFHHYEPTFEIGLHVKSVFSALQMDFLKTSLESSAGKADLTWNPTSKTGV